MLITTVRLVEAVDTAVQEASEREYLCSTMQEYVLGPSQTNSPASAFMERIRNEVSASPPVMRKMVECKAKCPQLKKNAPKMRGNLTSDTS